ncbi:hypothetical protein AgCh_013102 [Apium graveolens]
MLHREGAVESVRKVSRGIYISARFSVTSQQQHNTTQSCCRLGKGQDMVFTVYREHWRRMMRIITVPFFTNKVVQQYRFGWEDEAAHVVEDVKANPEAATKGIVSRNRLQLLMYNNMYRIMVDRKFESVDDPLFLKLKALNWERSRLAQSIEYNFGDFIPILRPFLRG